MDKQQEIWPRRWYALYLRSRYEKCVNEELRRKEIETFLPLVEEVHIWSDRKKKVMEPLFRGYVFVITDLRDKEKILQTEGVVNFVNIRAKPSPIPEKEIEWLRRIIGEPVNIRREPCLEIGRRVRITSGPLMGVEGSITCYQSVTRVVITLTAIAQAVSVLVSPALLELI
jgi:transcription antitermination factor NusG